MLRPPLPPFTPATAIHKLRLAEDAWTSHDPTRVALARAPDSRWRNRSTLLQVRAGIESFLTPQRQRELDYRPTKEPWTFREGRIAAQFACERHGADGQSLRSQGNKNRAFDGEGLKHTHIASINDLPITEAERLHHWPAGRRPDDRAGLTGLGL